MNDEHDPLDKRWLVVSHEEYERIQAEIAEPPKVLPRLARLLSEPSELRPFNGEGVRE